MSRRVAGGMTSIIVAQEIGFAREFNDRFVFVENGVVVESEPNSRPRRGSSRRGDAAHPRESALGGERVV